MGGLVVRVPLRDLSKKEDLPSKNEGSPPPRCPQWRLHCDLCQTSERNFKTVSVGQRVLQNMCPHMMGWVQAKSEKSLITGAVRTTTCNVQPISFNYQEYDAKP